MRKSLISAVMRELNSRRNKKLSKEDKTRIAKVAALARWKKVHESKQD